MSGSLAEANLYRFSSKEQHVNSGLAYYLFRYYSPNLQRWLNQDSLGDIGSLPLMTAGMTPWDEPNDDEVELTEDEAQATWAKVNRNLYATMANNPINMIDPLGLAELPCGGGPGSMNPQNIAAADMRTAAEIAKAAAERAKQQMAKAVQTMIKQAAKEGPKSLQKSIRSFDKRIAEHLKKIADNPNSPAVNHWKKEILNWQRLKEAAEKVLKACPKE
jgi:RHS repeat-associated protein